MSPDPAEAHDSKTALKVLIVLGGAILLFSLILHISPSFVALSAAGSSLGLGAAGCQENPGNMLSGAS